MAIRYSGNPTTQYISGQEMKVTLSGLNDAYKKLSSMAEMIGVAQSKLIESLVFDGVVIAKEEVPVDTGELRDSIHGEISDKSGRIIAGTDHCLFVEFGTGVRGRLTSPISPDDSVNYIYDLNNRNWRGNKANPFMHRTAVRLREDMRERIREFFKAVTK